MPKVKKCFILCCKNTSINSANTLFLTLPIDKHKRVRWYQTVGIPVALIGAGRYCCEDHFNLEEDVENWQQFKMIGSLIRLKPDMVPHRYISMPPKEELASQLTDNDKKQKREIFKQYSEKSLQNEEYILGI